MATWRSWRISLCYPCHSICWTLVIIAWHSACQSSSTNQEAPLVRDGSRIPEGLLHTYLSAHRVNSSAPSRTCASRKVSLSEASSITFFTSLKRSHFLLTCWRHSYRVCTCRCWRTDLLISEQLEGAYDVVNCTAQHKPRTTSYTVASFSFMSESHLWLHENHTILSPSGKYLQFGQILRTRRYCCRCDDKSEDIPSKHTVTRQIAKRMRAE